MKTAVIVFPGSNCDKDIGYILNEYYNHTIEYIWHKDNMDSKFDLVVVPGGFSYGDYLRCGAIAKFSNAMKSLKGHVEKGRKVLGICNGFQILTEANLLPGTLMRNKNLKHICKSVYMKKGSPSNPLTQTLQEDDILEIPISHSEGNYFADEDTLKQMEDQGQILLRYAFGNPNGSVDDIAGITSKDYKIIGLMPHPERAVEDWSGSKDGKKLFDSFLFNL
jgi:phosphoribosylformylglycinamidine synthase subunit PurQ / glutaminase